MKEDDCEETSPLTEDNTIRPKLWAVWVCPLLCRLYLHGPLKHHEDNQPGQTETPPGENSALPK